MTPKYTEERERPTKRKAKVKPTAQLSMKHLRDKIASVEDKYNLWAGWLAEPRSWHNIKDIRDQVCRLSDELVELRRELLARR